jgi:hypothetical protein
VTRLNTAKADGRSISPYSIVHLVIIGICLYGLILPWFSPMMSRAFPEFWQCQYKRMTDRPCPFCGMTRDFGDTYAGSSAEPQPRNPLSQWALVIVLAELLFRFVALWLPAKRGLVIADIAIHSALMLWLVRICVVFFRTSSG